MKKILIFNVLILSSLGGFSQTKKVATKAQKAPVVSTQTASFSVSANEIFNAINPAEYTIRPAVVNNNASLQIGYSPLLVFLDFQRIKSEASYLQEELQKNKQPISPFVAQLADMRYRNHVEFLPLDGTVNVTFIKPNLSINPKNVTTIPTNNISGQLKYRLSN